MTIDHVNPEAPWPQIGRLAEATRSRGLELAPRLPVYPDYVADLDRWVDPAVAPYVRRAADATGLARDDAWAPGEPGSVPFVVRREALPLEHSGGELGEDEITRLLEARGKEAAHVYAAADRLRREVCGDEVTYVVTRNIQYTNMCYFRCGFCAFSKGKLAANLRGAPYLVPLDEIVRRSEEAWERGATEVCLGAGSILRSPASTTPTSCARSRTPCRDPRPCLLGARGVAGRRDARALAGGVPREAARPRARLAAGTAAEVLDDRVRRVICPDKVTTAQWLAVRRGSSSRAALGQMFGHADTPRSWARHLLGARGQQRRSGGFTEFVPLPFVPMEAPMYVQGRARRGPTFREALLVHAVARLALHPETTNIQASWVKLGPEGRARRSRRGSTTSVGRS